MKREVRPATLRPAYLAVLAALSFVMVGLAIGGIARQVATWLEPASQEIDHVCPPGSALISLTGDGRPSCETCRPARDGTWACWSDDHLAGFGTVESPLRFGDDTRFRDLRITDGESAIPRSDGTTLFDSQIYETGTTQRRALEIQDGHGHTVIRCRNYYDQTHDCTFATQGAER